MDIKLSDHLKAIIEKAETTSRNKKIGDAPITINKKVSIEKLRLPDIEKALINLGLA